MEGFKEVRVVGGRVVALKLKEQICDQNAFGGMKEKRVLKKKKRKESKKQHLKNALDRGGAGHTHTAWMSECETGC